jgi:hypothetical protein
MIRGVHPDKTRTHMKHEGHARILKARPYAIEHRMARRSVARSSSRNPDRPASEPNRFFDLALRQLRYVQRNEAGRQQALVGRAEVRNCAVQRARAAVQ